MPTQLIDFKALREAADFETLLASYGITLIGTGEQRAALCPLHAEKKPSCKFNLKRKIFQCFGCKAKGNILDFVMQMEHTDNVRRAAETLAERCGISLDTGTPVAPGPGRTGGQTVEGPKLTVDTPKPPEVSGNPPPRQKNRSTAHSGASDDLPAGQAGVVNPPLSFTLDLDPTHPYFAQRGIKAELVYEFGLGFCSPGTPHGKTVENLICIPIHNERGELIAYAGRWPGEPPKEEPRWRLPKQFRKSHALFNLHRARGKKHLVVVEGCFDAIRLHALGIPTVALIGTAISAEQVALLVAAGTRAVTVMMDGDEAGRLAAADVAIAIAEKLFRTSGTRAVRIAELPDGFEPDTAPIGILGKLLPGAPVRSAR